jgi:hypothetical protein
MRNNRPKSEIPALKELAAKTKDKGGLLKSIESEKKHNSRAPGPKQRGSAASKSKKR